MKNEPIEFIDLELDGIDNSDYPDFCDAFVCGATAVLWDGTMREATEAELEKLSEDGEMIHNMIFDNQLYL